MANHYDDEGNLIKKNKSPYKAAKAEFKYEYPPEKNKSEAAPGALTNNYRTPAPGVKAPGMDWSYYNRMEKDPYGNTKAKVLAARSRLYPKPLKPVNKTGKK